MRRLFILLIIVAFLAVGWIIGWSNNALVQFQFLAWQSPGIPVYCIYIVFLSLGLLLGILLGYFARSR